MRSMQCVCARWCLQNLSEEVEVEAFYDFFSKFGGILQCKTDTDNYGQVRAPDLMAAHPMLQQLPCCPCW